MFSVALWRYVLTAVLRDRLIHLMLVLLLLGAALALFLGGAATLEQNQYTVALAGTILRIVAVLGLTVFISFFLRRAFESREIDYLLATPLSRTQLLFSMAVAFMCIALLLSCLISLVMFGLDRHVNPGIITWCASVIVELVITSMMALFFACVLKSATISTLCTLGFYTLSRMIGMMIGIVEAHYVETSGGYMVMAPTVKIISIIIPRFDLLAQSAWIVFGKAALPLWILPVETLVFCALFFACAIYDLRRNQF